ncbi:MAG: YIP1 family protein [Thermomicrobiales bacterium]
MMQQTGNVIVDRSIGVIKLDVPTYETIEHDPVATKQAAIVVGVVAVAGGIGGLGEGVAGFVVGLIGAFVIWLVFSGLAYFFGTSLFGTPTTNTTFEAVLRTIGYAQVPGIVAFVGFIPFLGALVGLIGGIWAIVTSIIAIRQSLNITTGRAIITGIVAAIAAGLIMGIISLVFGVGYL